MNNQTNFNSGMNNGDYGYGYSNPYSGTPAPPRFASPMQPQMQPQVTTNISLVTSLEEAKYRANGRNMDLIFFNQNKDEFYRIKVDNEGVKSWATFPFIAPNQPDTVPATVGELRALQTEIESLKMVVAQLQSAPKIAPRPTRGKKEEVTDSGELDG